MKISPEIEGNVLIILLKKYPEHLKELFDAGYDPNLKMPFSSNLPLIHYIAFGNPEYLKDLITAGADVNVSYDGLTLLHVIAAKHPEYTTR